MALAKDVKYAGLRLRRSLLHKIRPTQPGGLKASPRIAAGFPTLIFEASLRPPLRAQDAFVICDPLDDKKFTWANCCKQIVEDAIKAVMKVGRTAEYPMYERTADHHIGWGRQGSTKVELARPNLANISPC